MEQGEERGGSRREMGALRMGDKNMVGGGLIAICGTLRML